MSNPEFAYPIGLKALPILHNPDWFVAQIPTYNEPWKRASMVAAYYRSKAHWVMINGHWKKRAGIMRK